MKKSEAQKLLEQSHALRPCSTCKDWSYKTDARCPDCKTSPKARISIQERAVGIERNKVFDEIRQALNGDTLMISRSRK